MKLINKTNFADRARSVIGKFLETDGNKIIKNKYGEYMWKKEFAGLTTSKIRNLLSLTNALYNQALHIRGDVLSEDIIHDIQYLKMRFAYESGRERAVEKFVKAAHIMECLNEIGDSKDELLLFCNYMESLVAYHKYYGGRDK